jgi:hypothetical protein
MSDHAQWLATEPPLLAGSTDGTSSKLVVVVTYQVTVAHLPTVQTVLLSGMVTVGDQTSLFDKCKLDRPDVGVAEAPSAKEKRSAALPA